MLIRRRVLKTRLHQRGVSAIEFAILLPFMIVFLYGVLSYAVTSMYQLSLNAMASDAARAAMIVYSSGHSDPEQAARNRTEQFVTSSWLSNITTVQGCAAGGGLLSVDTGILTVCLGVDLPIQPLALGGWRLPDVTSPLTGEASVSVHN